MKEEILWKNTSKNFWSKVDIKNKDECWNWLGSKNNWGYGVACLNDGKGGIILAHRLAYILTNGDIPDEIQVQHSCNNPPCCNPQHLELGTNSKNMKYMVEQGRSCKGEIHPNSKLNEDNVREIHRLYKGRGLDPKPAVIAEMFTISKREVQNILCGETWRHIYDEIHKKEELDINERMSHVSKYSRFKSVRIENGKQKFVLVDICGEMINENPTEEELKDLKQYIRYRTRDINKWSDSDSKEYLLEFLRQFYRRVGRIPESRDFIRNPKYPSFRIYQNEFGSWNIAIREAKK